MLKVRLCATQVDAPRTAPETAAWLRALGFDAAAALAQKAAVDGAQLMQLTEGDLQTKLGVRACGARSCARGWALARVACQ